MVEYQGKRSTLVGTMHAEVDVSSLSPAIFDELSRARVLITEADVRPAALSSADLLEAVQLEGAQSVEDLVAPEDWQHIRAAAPSVDPAILARMQPWFTEGQVVLARLPHDIEPVDAGLVARAETGGVALAFFETWQEQVAALNGLGVEDGLAVLLPTARDPDAAVAAHLDWADAYQEGDVEAMSGLAFDRAAVEARPAYYEQIVFRHEGWLARVEDELRQGDAVIAVGFMHLLTERGLPAQLASRGFAVSQR